MEGIESNNPSSSLQSPSSSDVSMDSSSGWLSVSSPLDREKKGEYSLTARVVDQGGKSTDLPFTLKVQKRKGR